MPSKEARRIELEAIEKDDAKTWIQIQEQVLLQNRLGNQESTWLKFIRSVRNSYSIMKAKKEYSLKRSAELSLQKSKLQHEARKFHERYAPEIVQWVVLRSNEIDRMASGIDSNLGRYDIDSNELLASQYEMQGRFGEASDRIWAAFVDQYRSSSFERFLKLNVFGSDFITDIAKVESIMRELVNRPNDPWLLRFAGIHYWRSGIYAEAEPLLAKAAELFSDDPEGRFALADSRSKLNMPFDPVRIMGQTCRKSIHFETQEAMRLYFRAELISRTNHFEVALIDAEAAVRLDTRFSKAWALIAELSNRAGDRSRATEAELQADKWRNAETRLLRVIRRHCDENAGALDREYFASVRIGQELIDSLRDSDWNRFADGLDKFERLRNSGKQQPLFFQKIHEIPELMGEFPDRFFQARPVLRTSEDK
jgi:tetratricopeptide (TPR) repeat protein